MNPLTQVKNTQKITAREAALGISDAGSWHAKYKDSAYIYVGNFAFDLTEGDLLAIFAQYGEIVDLNLIRDKGTGKSRGFAFLAYEDQRSTVLAVDNLNGANVVGRTIKVDHVANYKRKTEEDEEEEQRKREERGVCRAFQRGECNRGSACKFSHDEKRSANTGWGSKDDATRWTHDKYDRASQQARRNGDEDGSRRDSGSRLKERQGIDGSRRDGGSRLQESNRLERNSSVESERGYRSKTARKGRDENQVERGSEERDYQHRDREDRKDQRDRQSYDIQRRRRENGDEDRNQRDSGSRLKEQQGIDGSRRDGGRSRLQESNRLERNSSVESERGYRSKTARNGRDENRIERGSKERDHQHRDREERKDQRDRQNYDLQRRKREDDMTHRRDDDTQERRSDDEESKRGSKSRKLDSSYHSGDEYNSGRRRSRSEIEKRDSRDEKHLKHGRR